MSTLDEILAENKKLNEVVPLALKRGMLAVGQELLDRGNVLSQIANFVPESPVDEWSEAAAFHAVQKIARDALARRPE